MGLMYPRLLPTDIRESRERDAECLLFDALTRLSGSYRVFYSVAWLNRNTVKGAYEGEADFVVVHPQRGILVIEVKGGLVSRDPLGGQWFTKTRHTGMQFEIKDPIAQARRNKHNLAEKLESLPHWVAGKPKLGHAVAFPHCDLQTTALGPDCPREIALYAQDLASPEAAVERIYSYWSGSTETCSPVDAAAMRAIVALLAPSVELRLAPTSRAAQIVALESQIAQLTRTQEKVLTALAKNRRVAISGGAGTGKTTLALAKAKNLAEQGFRTLLTCYNRPLADHLRRSSMGWDRLEVSDFHQFCLATSTAAGLSVGPPTGSKYWDETLPNLVVEALTLVPQKRFDAIVVDEAQDFLDAWWLPLQFALRDPDCGVLYVFFDDNQRLYRRVTSFPPASVEFSLFENLRNTKEIHRSAARFYSGGELLAVGPTGPAVEHIEAIDSAAQRREIGKLLDRLIRDGVSSRDIAVLTGRSVQASSLGGDGAFGKYPWTDDQEREPNKPLFESIARFKGLERPVIVLSEIEDQVTDGRDESLYVGLSRARSLLAVVGSLQVLRYVGCDDDSVRNHRPPTDYLRALLGQ